MFASSHLLCIFMQEHLKRSGLFCRGSSDRADEDCQRDSSRLGGHQLAFGRLRNGFWWLVCKTKDKLGDLFCSPMGNAWMPGAEPGVPLVACFAAQLQLLRLQVWSWTLGFACTWPLEQNTTGILGLGRDQHAPSDICRYCSALASAVGQCCRALLKVFTILHRIGLGLVFGIEEKQGRT